MWSWLALGAVILAGAVAGLAVVLPPVLRRLVELRFGGYVHRFQVPDTRLPTRVDEPHRVVVVGAGAAGCCAAIEARAGGSAVVVLERASGAGGLTASAAGHIYMGGGTRVQKAVGVEDTVADMEAYLVSVTPEPDRDKIRLYCEESVAHFDWLVAQGIPFNDSMYKGKHVLQMTDECLIWSGNEEVHPYREQARPAPRGHKVAQEGEAGGAKLMELLIARCEALGVRIECDTAVRELIRDGDRVVGVRTRRFDEERTVRARRGVVLATGHFTANEAMLREHDRYIINPFWLNQRWINTRWYLVHIRRQLVVQFDPKAELP